jgi:hypothetical protein
MGQVSSISISESSKSLFLDYAARDFIYAHWKSPDLSGADVIVPITYAPPTVTASDNSP